MISKTSVNGKEPWLAVILSTIFPGLGQIYAGKTVRGLIIIFSAFILIYLTFWFIVLSPTANVLYGLQILIGYFLFSIFNLFDAHRCSRKVNNTEFEILRKGDKDPWLSVFLSSIIPGLGHAYQGKWLFALIFFILIVGAALLSSTFPQVYLVGVALLGFSFYHAYTFSPTHRARSQSLILGICLVLLIPNLFNFSLPSYIKEFVAEPRYIPSTSMTPTLQQNDRIIIDKRFYRSNKPAFGEILTFYPPAVEAVPDHSLVFIKRLIGLPGDRISIREGKVFVNNKPLTEPYIKESIDYTLPTNDLSQCQGCFQPSAIQRTGANLSFIVPPNSYWMMGDNRNNSLDSHAWGFLPSQNIVGRATKIYWPPERVGIIK